jgi:hypothetical protein
VVRLLRDRIPFERLLRSIGLRYGEWCGGAAALVDEGRYAFIPDSYVPPAPAAGQALVVTAHC